MTKTQTNTITEKWRLVLEEYELIKQKRSNNFSSVNQLCDVSQVHRKDTRKYYERWMKGGKVKESLLPRKRGPKPGQLKILTKDEERTIIKIQRRLQANEHEIFYMIEGHFHVHP